MGRKGGQFMRSLNQPSHAPPIWAWSLIGVAYYLICFFGLYRLLGRGVEGRLGLISLIVLMAANTVWNYIYFRLRNLKLAFWYSVGYSAFAGTVLLVLIEVDHRAALALATYVAYLPFALLLSYRTWKLNT